MLLSNVLHLILDAKLHIEADFSLHGFLTGEL